MGGMDIGYMYCISQHMGKERKEQNVHCVLNIVCSLPATKSTISSLLDTESANTSLPQRVTGSFLLQLTTGSQSKQSAFQQKIQQNIFPSGC